MTRWQGRARSWLLFVLCVWVFPAAASLRTIESAEFIIAGDDPVSVLYVREMAVRGVAIWTSVFGAVPHDAPAVVLLLNRVSPADAVPVEGRLRGENLTVEISWHSGTIREDLCYALALGWWKRAARYATGNATIPEWLVVASALQLEVQANALYREILWLEEKGCILPFPPLASVLGSQERSGINRLAAMVLLESVQSEIALKTASPTLADWLELASPEALIHWLPKRENVPAAALPELWWATQWVARAAPRPGARLTFEESVRTLDALVELTLFFEGEERRVNVAAIPALAGNPGLATQLERPSERIRLALPRIHPIYHNALLSLGQVYEAIAKGDGTSADALIDAYGRDRRSADQLASEIKALLASDY